MGKDGVAAVGGNRTHLEGYARSFAADPRCEIIAITDEPGLSNYREGLNRLLASELEVPYLPLEEVLALGPGAIIELNKSSEDELDLLVNNKQVGHGLAVKVGENFGIQIKSIESPLDRIEALGPA